MKRIITASIVILGISFFISCNRHERGLVDNPNAEEGEAQLSTLYLDSSQEESSVEDVFVDEEALLLTGQNDKNTEFQVSQEEEKKPLAPDFLNSIVFTNCSVTTDYTVPEIINQRIGISDDEPPWEMVEKNRLRWFWGGFQIILRNDVFLENGVTVTAKNSKFEFTETIEMRAIRDNSRGYYDDNPIIGYYQNVIFEPKFWLTDGNVWQILVKAGDETLVDDDLSLGITVSLFYYELNETPFVVDNLRYVELQKEYTYRCIKEGTDLIVVYYTPDYGTYEPVLYLIPDENDDKNYYDIGVS